METDKKTGLYGLAIWDRSPVRSQKKLDRIIQSGLRLDRTVQSSLRLNCSYAYMNIASFRDFRKAHHNDSTLYL